MKLQHIPLGQLVPSSLNVRKVAEKASDPALLTLAASIRSLGLLQPLLVRAEGEVFAIVAGSRRYRALFILAQENAAAGVEASEPVPCLVMDDGDDAAAIEASLAENIARLPMDEIDQYRAFSALKVEGLSVSDIAARFGVTERLVEQRLAIAGIIPPILTAYRKGDIRPETLRLLTMATPRQQKEWWTLYKSEDSYAPTGRALKDWLLGGAQLPVSNALFDLALYDGAIVSDLFAEERYFADSAKFWALQNGAIAQKREAYLAARWAEVVVLDVGQGFSQWSHVKTPRTRGGKVFIAIAANGEVTAHEGYLTEKEAKARAKAQAKPEDGSNDNEATSPERDELTKVMRTYLGLHKHAAVRTGLLGHPGLALRLAVAHMVCGSSLWRIAAEPQRADSRPVAESLAASKAQEAFNAEREEVRALLGFRDAGEETDGGIEDSTEDMDSLDEEEEAPPSGPVLSGSALIRGGSCFPRPDIRAVLGTLIDRDDDTVLRILACLMAETLDAHTPLIETLGALIGTDMGQWWSPEPLFFDLLRDKAAINAMLREVAGPNTADAHLASTAKLQKKIIADCLSGTGREKVENWLPRYMAFPARDYREVVTPAPVEMIHPRKVSTGEDSVALSA
ncbi:ParB/RepB/Spo0J family partition protein [Xanthobacter autotrophicus]|uniref:ParB/RepB/Spo0J family partition protein n=1 Tax=Xanthobacter autotrophicus TaxID=280 RepID=UPI00372A7013